MKSTNFLIAFIIQLLIFSFTSSSQDRNFAWTYQTNTLPKGVRDLEVWNTLRSGRNYFYNRLDQRVEFEFGITDKLQSSIYLNTSHISQAVHLDTLGGIADTSASGANSNSEFSFSSEWKYRLTNHDPDRISAALYFEFTVAPAATEIEFKLLLDKRSEKNILALNLVAEQEWEYDVVKGKKDSEEELKFETDLGWLHMLKNNFGLGIEFRNNNLIEDEWLHSDLFGGPTLFYGSRSFFLIAGILPQWTNLHKSDEAPNNLELVDHEKIEVRLLLGFGL